MQNFHSTKNEVFHYFSFTEEIRNGKLHFLCSVWQISHSNEARCFAIILFLSTI